MCNLILYSNVTELNRIAIRTYFCHSFVNELVSYFKCTCMSCYFSGSTQLCFTVTHHEVTMRSICVDLPILNLGSVPEKVTIWIKSGVEKFPKYLQTLQNSTRPKCDVKQAPCRVPTSIYCHHTKFSRNCDLARWICAPLDNICTGGPPYPRVIRANTYRGYGKPWIIRNAICNVI